MAVKEPEDLVEQLARTQSTLQQVSAELGETRAAVLQLLSERPGITAGEVAERFGVNQEALVAMLETLRDVLGERALSVPVARRAALIAASSQAWEDELGPLLTSAQVRELLGDISRQRVDELLRRHRLIGLRDRSGRRQFPAFQFHDGRPVEALIAAFWTVADAAVSEWTAASWCTASDEALASLSPVQWAREGGDPERLATVARQDAARLAQ
jgi:DNA-binding transcriptional ArsR family regulator